MAQTGGSDNHTERVICWKCRACGKKLPLGEGLTICEGRDRNHVIMECTNKKCKVYRKKVEMWLRKK
jgi:hypothetical protein